MSDGVFVCILQMHVGEKISKWGVWSILKVEYENLMELVVDDDINYDESEVIKMRFESHCEIGEDVKQMCINLYNGGSIDYFEYGEDFCQACSGFSSDEYESEKSRDEPCEDCTPYGDSHQYEIDHANDPFGQDDDHS